MDPDNPLIEILRQINELSGAALDGLLNAEGGGSGGEPPAPPAEGGEPAPEGPPA